jgi:hypothetical protein
MTRSNIGLELTASSVRSCLAPASSSSSGPAFGPNKVLVERAPLCLESFDMETHDTIYANLIGGAHG